MIYFKRKNLYNYFMEENIFDIIEDDMDFGDYPAVLEKIEIYLEKHPDDLTVLKLEAKVLLYDKQYEESRSLCDELLENRPKDIELLLIKAKTYFEEASYSECISISQEILKIKPESVAAKELIEDCNWEINKPLAIKFFTTPVKNSCVIFGVVFLALLFFAYLIPSKEIVTCDSNYSCTIKKEYLNSFETKKEIKISQNSTFSYKAIYVPIFTKERHERYHFNKKDNYILLTYIDKHRLFRLYKDCYSNKEDLEYSASNIQKDFQKYLKNPQNGFQISSFTNIIFLYIFVAIVLFSVFYFYFKTKRF